MTKPEDPNRQRTIRMALVIGMVIAAGGLVFVVLQATGKGGAGDPPALARSTMNLQIVDRSGTPIHTANVFLLGATSDAPATAEWTPDHAWLKISAPSKDKAAPRSVRVTARGFRTQEVHDLRRDSRIILDRGLHLRLKLTDVPESGIPEHIRVLLRVKPADMDPSMAGAAETIELMDNLGAAGSGPKHMPRGGFGYPVSLAQADAGVLVPAAGAYYVHWGLIDTKAETWFSLGDPCGRRIQVRDMPEPQTFVLAMTYEDLQRTLEGLARGVATVKR